MANEIPPAKPVQINIKLDSKAQKRKLIIESSANKYIEQLQKIHGLLNGYINYIKDPIIQKRVP